MPALKEVIMYLLACKPVSSPLSHHVVAILCLFFFLWSCLNSHLALPLSSSRSSTKQGAWGVFTHFPSPLSYTLITGLELLDNAESVTFFFFFFPFLAALLVSLTVHQFQAALILDDLFIRLSICVPLKKWYALIVQWKHNELMEIEALIFQLVLFLLWKDSPRELNILNIGLWKNAFVEIELHLPPTIPMITKCHFQNKTWVRNSG